MTTINHWGKWIDSDVPTTGVLSTNHIAWEYLDNEVCLTCLEIQMDIESDESLTDEEKDSELEFTECDSSHEKIIGDWTKDEQGLYIPDRNGEYSAILRETTVQVVWSKFVTTGNICSPCYPGQIDLDSKGEFKAYTLPEYLIYKP